MTLLLVLNKILRALSSFVNHFCKLNKANNATLLTTGLNLSQLWGFSTSTSGLGLTLLGLDTRTSFSTTN